MNLAAKRRCLKNVRAGESVLRFRICQTTSVTVVQDIFARNFVKNHRIGINKQGGKQFQDTGCLGKNKSPGRKETKTPKGWKEFVICFTESLKSTRRAGAELAVPHTTVWRVFRKRLHPSRTDIRWSRL
ncbi:hypothetical protein TNIN_326561 [Trichonephila inaurata madagascariensis]|uniref:Transposase n=1 Tax=Trichonephila inaurata madagascariensis TaxID=2747483 RepID=A0A8X6X0T1_9ARAC|nr:hypothetical protein TNIN_326561 [Trichonephila inaurata madagascariensis]